MLFSELEKITKGTLDLFEDFEISRFLTDTRITSPGHRDVFIAIKGNRDGHSYIQSAIDKGIRSFIVSQPVALKGCNVLVVDDTLEALQQIASYHRSRFQIPVIGITGSNGKTTVKEWLSVLLSQQYYVAKSPKSFNSQIGVPLSILELSDRHEVGVFEAGISKKGEMKKLRGIIKPTLGIFTNLGEAHDDGFSSREEKLFEKLQLFQEVKKVIVRQDFNYYPQVSSVLRERQITWSLKEGADYHVKWNQGKSIEINGVEYQTNFRSDTQLENLTHAILGARLLSVTPQQIQAGISQLREVPMRLELKRGIHGCFILDDSYNNDEIGIRVALDYLESHKQNDSRTLILSDILHSAKPDQVLYSDIASLLKAKNISRLVGVGPRIKAHASLFTMKADFFENTEELLAQFPDFNHEMIVVKGARNFALEQVVKHLEEKNHGTVLEINFEALQHNLNAYRKLLSPTTKLMVMVKANAYGSGLEEVANFLQHQRVDMLGVAYVDEAIKLRNSGIKLPIMIMNPYIESFGQFERYDLQAEIFSLSHLKRLLSDTSHHPKIHIKVDTGMHRLGFAPEQIEALIDLLKQYPQVQVAGIFTHFSSADISEEDAFTHQQAKLFDAVYDQIVDSIGYKPIKHACNSPAMVRWPQYHYDMVRLGIGLHSFDPTGKLALRYTSRLKTTISQIQSLKAGETVGYARKGRLTRDSRIAVLPIGYEDGYMRRFGNGRAFVNVNGVLCPTVGNICMDMTMVDVTETEAKEGDEVIIFGQQPTIKELATWGQTIPYEILTNISSRVSRVFISE